MSFDARSRERLEALGRQLPRPLPAPAPPTPAAGAPAPGSSALERRHPVETEQDPQKLFRALMNVSADGSVPPHLLERLRQLETPPAAGSPRPGPAGERLGNAIGNPSGAAASPGGAPRRPAPTPRTGAKRRLPADDTERELYTAFQQLLLEDGD
ncbi:hypothetical protein L107_06293 [Cyanobium sp. Copco_Reservoir_LC18]|uniref:hypothetical protein n=1 Tax=Cyanobium sp. Copco_Reservoir_LC18 TaxID=1328305 RepID=UPI00135847D6|nr:hypothetical protein [Cyanobium sp. Copco_Reservoir_LC18]KAF0653957.1 hypothetical protein L107_06293 [Cyanobium sp. Copco_Reservoir_LC18]